MVDIGGINIPPNFYLIRQFYFFSCFTQLEGVGMTNIIQFQPNYSRQFEQQKAQRRTTQPKDDTYEKMEAAFDAQVAAARANVPKPKTPKNELINRAWINYDKAMDLKKRNLKLIHQAEYEDFNDIFTKQGNKISFFQDKLGRYVMVEYDGNGEEKRATTFTPYEDKIWKIQSPKKSIVFYSTKNDYTEISQTKKTGMFKYSREVYTYENGRPTSYSKYDQNLFSEDVLKETLDF